VAKTYTARGELASITDELGHTTSYAYDEVGQLISKVTPRGNLTGANPSDYTWSYAHDANGNLTSVIDSLGHETTSSYDALNRRISVTDPLSHTISFSYDANDNVTAKTDALSHTVSASYDDLDRPTSTSDGRDKETTYGYDANGNLTSVTDPLGNTETFSYDDASRLSATVDPRGNASGANPDDYKTSYQHDEAGNVTSITDPLAHTTTLAYDRDGRLQSKTDALSHTLSYGYDTVGRLASVTAPDSSTTSYGYDDVGNRTSRTDANLHTTSYGYDSAHRLTSLTTPLGNAWTYNYDAENHLTSRVDAIANAASNPTLGTTSYSFDRAGRVTGIDYSDTTPDITYGYDAVDRLTSLTDGAGTKSYSYDAANRLTAVARGTTGFSYSYDAADNLTQTTQPDSTTISHAYDDAEQLTSLTQGSNVTGYTYDRTGALASKTLPNGITETRSYDHAGSLTEIGATNGSTPITDFQITRDAVGNPTRIDKLGGGVEAYGYDNFNRLTSVCFQSSCPNGSDPKISWTYDSIGRRQTETRPSGTLTYSYNADDQATSTSDGTTTTSYSYDADGRQTAKGSSGFTYDVAGNLTTATVGSATTNYTYDGNGNRLSASDNTNSTGYLWDENTLSGLPELARESDGSGNLIRRYLSDAEGASTLQTNAGSFYYLRNHQESIAQLTDASANTEWTYTYDPFGETKTATKVDPAAPDNPMQYNGQYVDAASNLYNLRARQYDPGDGRFLSTDPVGSAINKPCVSAYSYAGDQPTALADPAGTSACGIAGGLVAPAASALYGTAAAVFNATQRVLHLIMSAGLKICDAIANPFGWNVKRICGVILVTVTIVAPWLFAAEGEGFLAGVLGREAYTAGRSLNVTNWARTLAGRIGAGERFGALPGSIGGRGAAAEVPSFVDGAGVAAEEEATLVNSAGRAYPRVPDPRTGEPIPTPTLPVARVPVEDRALWGARERGAFIKEWYEQGYSTPEGGWANYDIHHITPREYGGTNDFNNLVPVLRGTHQQEFNAWWNCL
jgi:RHS repeat-associated protein